MPTAFRLYSKLQEFRGQSGELLAGGQLRFTLAGAPATPKDVFGEKALSTNNGATITLDASGRPSHPIWGSGSYDVYLFDVDNVAQGEDLTVEIPGGDGLAITVPEIDEYVGGDGAVFVNRVALMVPDPTGQAGKVLGNDGETPIWEAKSEDPTVPTPDIVVGAGSFRAGVSTDDTKFLIQYGTGATTASGTLSASVTVTYAVPFAETPVLVATPKGGGVTPGGCLVRFSTTSESATGFTFNASTKTGGTSADNFGDSDITSAVNFGWVAVGTKEVPA